MRLNFKNKTLNNDTLDLSNELERHGVKRVETSSYCYHVNGVSQLHSYSSNLCTLYESYRGPWNVYNQ